MNLKKIKNIVEINVGLKNIETKRRKQPMVDARTIYFVLAKRLTNFTYETIAELVNRDHSSVTHAINEIYEGWKLQPNQFKHQLQLIDAIENQIMDINSVEESSNDVVKKLLHEYEIKVIMKNKIIDRLNEKIDSLEKRIDELKKYEPIW